MLDSSISRPHNTVFMSFSLEICYLVDGTSSQPIFFEDAGENSLSFSVKAGFSTALSPKTELNQTSNIAEDSE